MVDGKRPKLSRDTRGGLGTSMTHRHKGRPVAEPTIGFQLRRLPWEPRSYEINREEKIDERSDEI